ncbi:MAG TPA: metalloregulator ArsR/SmtB family transcription factor [Tepidisphaeraceae bacterium]|nr:metalloregulator ArsR/SmtB family transcription factor [Tepidisphaeraceae bacterium]
MVRTAGQVDLLMGWMGALADPTRLRLMRLIEQHELGVAELCEILQLPQSTVSRHLKVLADEGWAVSRRQGTVHLYCMAPAELDPAARRLWLVAREQTEPWPAVRQDQLRLARRLQERRNESEAFFAGAAGQWDKWRDEMYGRAFTEQAMLALLPSDAVVADLGCGTGQVAARLAPWVGKVIGIDSSAAMLKAARSRTDELPNVELRRGDLTSVPIDDSSCDAALMLLVLSYVADPLAALKETSRILKPGGRAVVIDLLPHDREDFRQRMGQQVLGFELAGVRTLLEESGLKVTRAMPLAPEPDVKGPGLFVAVAARMPN